MTASLILGQAVLAALLLAGHRLLPAPRERLVRGVAGLGAASGLWVFFGRDDLAPWRGMELASDDAVIAGLAITCTWGLVIALDLGVHRWWSGALAGVVSCALLAFAGARWTVPALLFLVCATAAASVATSRADRAAWVTLAGADLALILVLIADAIDRDGWELPHAVGMGLAVPLLASAALRSGLVVRIGPLGVLGTPASVLTPAGVAIALISVTRWVELPLPIPAAAVLLIGLAAALWAILGRRLDPSVVGVWPVALGGSLLLASGNSAVPAAITVLLGTTMVCLWPDALERGRLSRGLLLSGMAPTISFAALAIAARGSFTRVTEGGDPVEVGAWIAVSALLPVSFATGVALGVFAARSEPKGGYHPEAVFMTWILTAAAVVVGFVLGPGEVFGALGGGDAAVLFGIAASAGAFAAVRVDSEGGGTVEPSSSVGLATAWKVGSWAPATALLLYAIAGGCVAWITFRGLQVGFL